MLDIDFEKRVVVNPEGVTRADLVVGIPSLNEANSIRFPTVEAARGLKEFFAERKSVIINCDNFSRDGTKDAFLTADTEIPKIYLSTPEGVQGKGYNILNLFRMALELQAKAVVLVDADVRNISPVWIRSLAEPLFNGYDLVSPIYVRNRYEGTITSNIAYPLTRALFGKRIREPIGGEVGVSARMAEDLLKSDPDDSCAGYGINIWITILGIVRGFSLCQAFLAGPKTHRKEDPEAVIMPVFREIVESTFRLMGRFRAFWRNVRWSKPTVIFGAGAEEVAPAQEMQADAGTLYRKFREGFPRFEELWRRILHRDVFEKLMEVKKIHPDRFEFPALVWALVLFDYAWAYKNKKASQQVLMESLLPLYFGQTCSSAIATAHMSVNQVEVYIDDLCRVFEETKSYLDYLWEKS